MENCETFYVKQIIKTVKHQGKCAEITRCSSRKHIRIQSNKLNTRLYK